MVIISPITNLSSIKDSFTNSAINQKFKEALILEKPNDPSLANDHWPSGILDRIQRWGKSFQDSFMGSLAKEGFNFTIEDLNWLLASGIISKDQQKYLFAAYQNPSEEAFAVELIRNSSDLHYLPKEKADGTKLSGKELAMLWESGKIIQGSEYGNARETSRLFEAFPRLSVAEIYERSETLAKYVKKQEPSNLTDIFENFSKVNNYLPSDPSQYKKALDILIQYGSENKVTGDDIQLLATGISGLVKEYPGLSVDEIIQKIQTAPNGLNQTKVFHTNAPEAIYNHTGILLSSRGGTGKSKINNDSIEMPELNFTNEDFQISGHHILNFQEKTYLVYVAHNDSPNDASIKIENGGIGLTSESLFSNNHQYAYAKVHDTSNGDFTVGPGDKAASAVLDGKTDPRIRTDSQGEIDIPPNSSKIITAIPTNGYDGVTANINGHIDGSVTMTAAVITESEIQRYGSIENAVNHHLEQGNFLAEKHHGALGRAHGIYEGSKYDINKNLFLTDQAVSPDPKENILAESIIASTKYYGEEQSGKVITVDGRKAHLEGYSAKDGNIGNYNTIYELDFRTHHVDPDKKEQKIKVDFASLAREGRSDQAAFRGNIVLELKDPKGNIIQRIKRQVSIGFNEEVTAFDDVVVGPNVSSVGIKMINTADSTPPYEISVLKV
jgi:hypothetical protein